ncbi:MAG: NCS2 family permease [Firmicutes bacterium]|nr:NCS2 family permease [Bacillota bacterium]
MRTVVGITGASGGIYGVRLLEVLSDWGTNCKTIDENPNILADTGIPRDAAFVATALASAFATLFMGLYANYPIAVAPGMGLNAYFTYAVVKGLGLSWQAALGAVFISGVIFFLLMVTKIRQIIIDGVPQVLRVSIGVGIGLFIAFIGLKNAGVVVSNPATFVALGDMKSPGVLVAVFGLAFTGYLLARKVKGSLLIGMVATTIMAMLAGVTKAPTSLSQVVSLTSVNNLAPTFLKLDIGAALNYGLISIIFAFTFVDLFDNVGTLIGVSRKGGLLDESGRLPRINKALFVDSTGTMVGSLLGTSTVTSYIESAAGIQEGGRTGLTAVVVGLLFILALFFAPLVVVVPAQATAPILMLVGVLMMGEVANVKFDDFTEAFPAFLTIVMMPLTFSIAQGLAFGFMGYTFIKAVTGRGKEVSPVMYVLTALMIVHFALTRGA